MGFDEGKTMTYEEELRQKLLELMYRNKELAKELEEAKRTCEYLRDRANSMDHALKRAMAMMRECTDRVRELQRKVG